jgi:hypothetical protein
MVLKLMKSSQATSRVSRLNVTSRGSHLSPTSNQGVGLMLVTKMVPETSEIFNDLTRLVTWKISLTLAAMIVSDLT